MSLTSTCDELPSRWLRALVFGALGLSTAACSERTVDTDLGGETGDEAPDTETEESGEDEGEDEGESGMLPDMPSVPDDPPPDDPPPDDPPDPDACSADVIVEGMLEPDGTCAACGPACMEQVYAQTEEACSFDCVCDYWQVCTPTEPDEEGRCLHGFDYEQWCGGVGRPLLAAGEVRVAPIRARADWLCELPRVEVPRSIRARVYSGWLERAAMEHASVAAFARFTVQLMGLGAPAELLEDSQRASLDEARHARICYAMATALGAGPVGPDRLGLAGLELDIDPAQIALESILEGCIGETVAAAEMRLLAQRAADPQLASVLAAIAEDEAAHASLAWRALDWMCSIYGAQIEATVRSTFADAVAALSASSASSEAPAPAPEQAYGVLDEATRDWLRRTILAEVIAPAAAGLFDERRAA